MSVSTSVIVDTDIMSYILKQDTRAAVYEPYLQVSTRYFSFMTVAEMYYWAESRHWGVRLRGRLDALLRTCVVIDSNDALCRLWAETRYKVSQTGRHIALGDAWIAATALALGVPLVTHNRRDFVAVPGLPLLPEAT